MTIKKIRKELKKIYKDITSWPRINKRLKYKIPKEEIYRRGAIFSLQNILYEIERAKKERDKNKEYFYLASYYLTKPDTVLNRNLYNKEKIKVESGLEYETIKNIKI